MHETGTFAVATRICIAVQEGQTVDTQCGAYCESGEKESVTLFKPLEMRTSADRDESYPRIGGVVNETAV